MKRTTAAMTSITTTSDMKKISARHRPMCSVKLINIKKILIYLKKTNQHNHRDSWQAPTDAAVYNSA